jgi:hypothetical protein
MEILAIPPAHVDAGFRLAGAIVSVPCGATVPVAKANSEHGKRDACPTVL